MKRVLLIFALLTATSAVAQSKAPAAQPAASPELAKRVENYLRQLYAWGPAFSVKVGAPAAAELEGFYKVTIEVSFGGSSDTAEMLVSKDGRHLIRGEALDMNVDPFASARRGLHTEGRPARGPANARVTVVDFGDFQCPHCRQLDTELRQLIPQYPQVRFVMKHYPLAQIHPWAMTAALAAECAYRLKPDSYWQVHEAIFDQQEQITTDNAWQKLIDIATAAGNDPTALRTCMVSPQAKQVVEQDFNEGQALRVANTPTLFVNGRRLTGGDPALLRQYIDYELAATRPKP